MDYKKKCYNRWKKNYDEDERIKQAYIRFDDWINDSNDSRVDILYKLAENIEYFSREEVNKLLVELYNKLHLNILDFNNTIYTFIKSKNGKSNSSNDYWFEFKRINNISKNVCINDLTTLDPEQILNIQNIVFIDDFSGTGKSFINTLEIYKDKLENKNIFFVVVYLMKDAEEAIKEYEGLNNFNINLIQAFKNVRVFEKEEFKDEMLMNNLFKYSTERKINNNYTLGFEESQSLVSFYNNTPNNTIGLIWDETTTNKPIFPRIFERIPSWQRLKNKKKGRVNASYNNEIINNRGLNGK